MSLWAVGCAPDNATSIVIDEPAAVVATGVGGDSPVTDAINAAAQNANVPPAVLTTVAYAETRFRHVTAESSHVDHDGHAPARTGLFGLSAPELASASIDENDALEAHAFAAAEILAAHAVTLGRKPQTVADWHPAVARWRGAEHADAVMRHLARGLRGTDIDGNRITVTARPGLDAFAGTDGALFARQGYADALWNPAHSSNYASASRGASSINYIVVHTVQGSYGSAINWFKDSRANVSAHYVVRSSDGQVTQMVDDSDRAWHDACFNSETIGIEHEGYVSDPDLWYTESMYMASARIAAHAARTYNIPIDRQHFFGHGDAPDCSTHTDPGPGWDWDHYLALVRADGEPTLDAAFADFEWPSQMVAGEEAVVWFEFDNLSNMTWGLDETRLGTAEPQDRDSPFFVDGNWLSANRATGADHSNYAPGSTGRFTFLIRAPEVDKPTTYTETFQLVQEGVSWFGPTASATVTVVPRGWEPGDDDPDEDDNEIDDGDSGDNGAGGCSASQSGGLGGGGYAILLACAVFGLRRRFSCDVRQR